jgi:purine/pyrimidine-nucleoside phosphorylase
MAEPHLKRLEGVNVELKANIYFDGKVVSHTVLEKNGDKKTLGLIYPGSYSFNTGKPERMLITSGTCKVRLDGEAGWKNYNAGNEFRVPGDSRFEIAVDRGITEYLCIFE